MKTTPSTTPEKSTNVEKKLGNGTINHVSESIELEDTDAESSPIKSVNDQKETKHINRKLGDDTHQKFNVSSQRVADSSYSETFKVNM